jgi:hypothetical protein
MTIHIATLLLIIVISATLGVGMAAMMCAAGRADDATHQYSAGYKAGWRAGVSAVRYGKKGKDGAA